MTPKNNTKSVIKSINNTVGIMTTLMSVRRQPCGNQCIELPYELMGQFVYVVAFNAGGYFRTDRQALIYGDFLVSLSSSMPNLFWNWGWSGYRGVFEYMGVFGMFSLFLY